MSIADRRRIAVAAGGTAGHILTALDILAAWRSTRGADGVFIGSQIGFEARLAPKSGEKLELIPSQPWARQTWFGRLRAAAAIGPAVLAARRILIQHKTEIVIGAGGYASAPPCIAAWSLGLRVAIHEANAFPGLANRLLATIADLVCVDSDETARSFRGKPRCAVTGTPCSISEIDRGDPLHPYEILVLGGSEGSPWLNKNAPGLFAALREFRTDFTVHHLAGMSDPSIARASYANAGVSARISGWVDDMRPIYAGAALAIACPGARTLAELSLAGIPAILTPLAGAAQDHQRRNAELYIAQTGAHLIDEQCNIQEVARWMHDALSNRDGRHVSPGRMQNEAAAKIVAECEKLFTCSAETL